MFPCLDHGEQCFSERGGADIRFQSFGQVPSGGVVLEFVAGGSSILFCTVAAPVRAPPGSARGSPFSASSPTPVASGLFDDSHSDGGEVIPRCRFDLRSLMMSDVLHLLTCLLAVGGSSLEKRLCESFFLRLFGSFVVESRELLVFFGRDSFTGRGLRVFCGGAREHVATTGRIRPSALAFSERGAGPGRAQGAARLEPRTVRAEEPVPGEPRCVSAVPVTVHAVSLPSWWPPH